jgi:hypothetical protein
MGVGFILTRPAAGPSERQEIRTVNPHGKILGLVPYDFRTPSLARARETFWNAEDERFLVPTFFGVGWTLNLRSAPRHPLQAFLIMAFVVWCLYVRRSSGRER